MTARLTFHLFIALLSLASVAMFLTTMLRDPGAEQNTLYLIGTFGSTAYAAYSLASVITTITERTK